MSNEDCNSVIFHWLLCFIGGQDLHFIRVVVQLDYNRTGFVVSSRGSWRPVGSVKFYRPVLCVEVQYLSQPGFEKVDRLSSFDPLF